MELIETEKGKPCALYNGYAYRKYRENKQGVVTWCCLKEKTSKCKGRIMSQDAEVIRVVDHQCVPDEASIDVKKAIFNVKKRTREESDTQIRQIYNEEFNSLQNMGYEFVTSLPQFSNVRSSLYSIRNQAQGVQKEPKQPGEVTFDEETLKMSDGNNFLLADNGVVDRILIFAGVKQREVMREKTSFFMDGTFRSCSAQFSQLYTIHVDLGSTLEETNVVPVIFALLPNKRKETYVRMFRMILEEVPNWVPDTVHIDFEASAISALREVFPSVNINGCYFHFTKCLWRQVQDIGLTNLYKEDSDVRFHIRLCAALAFLKPEDVDEGWILIQETAPSNEKLSEFFNYFVEQWLDNPTLTKEIWSCYHRKHRTNNAVEGWNNKINSALGRPHPRVKELIKHLKSEAEQSNLKIVRLELHMEGVKRKKKYVKLDERIDKITKRYEENSEIKEFLTKIQYVLKLE